MLQVFSLKKRTKAATPAQRALRPASPQRGNTERRFRPAGRTDASHHGAVVQPVVNCAGASVSLGKIFFDFQALAFNGFYTNSGIQKSIRRDT
ncbi:MAG: hypothetical protein AB1Z20_23970 [Desulfobacterales bacterium]